MSRPAIADIHLDHLRHNYQLARRVHGHRVLAALKANAYGHGAVPCAQALSGLADGFGVAAIEEALELRAAGITAPILLLEGFFDASELPLIAQHKLWLTVHHRWQVDALLAAELSQPLHVWLKLDSGMHRVGLDPQEYRAAHAALLASGKVSEMVLMSHFARADELDAEATRQQLALFQQCTEGLSGARSLANSPGLMGWPAAHSDWGRAGIMLYGSTPFPQSHPIANDLKPVMRLSSKVIGVRELAANEPIGYGGATLTSRPSRIGVVALGYADGYPRIARNGTPVAIDGQHSQLLGRVSMDMLTVDLTDLPACGLGSEVELWGPTVRVEQVAASAQTISYEILCNVKRAHFRYHGGKA
ncbi:alanine racemase [Leeia aquatica]|uniref:Alanine racemase n=1 Tax=Leeia aquatica TaxID=2725557 RepID=A0A847S6C7_9NEIS|nr:alanine racemase [Leeia aquatica]NLR74617.1 alanine racemase [Leeia aquatica]